MELTLAKKRPNILPAVLLLLVAAFLFLLFQKPEPIPAKKLRFPVGEKLILSDVVPKVKGGKLTEPKRKLNSSKEGSITLTYTVKNLIGLESDKEIMITFYEEEKPKEKEETKEETKTEEALNPPVITGPDTISLLPGQSPDMSVFSATDHKGNTLEILLSGDYDSQNMGTYVLTLSATDREGVKTEKAVTVTVTIPGLDEKGKPADGEYRTASGKTMVIENGLVKIDGVLIVNKTYPLPSSYTSPYLQPEAESAYFSMKAAAKKAGYTLTIKSARRSWEDQSKIFSAYVKEVGLEETLTFSARPGHSEHQTGLAMDLITAETVDAKKPHIRAIFDWLNQNAYQYGFVLRYPENKEHITGYIYEPWHYRYVGEDLAKTLYNGGDWITIEEYFGIDSVYRGY